MLAPTSTKVPPSTACCWRSRLTLRPECTCASQYCYANECQGRQGQAASSSCTPLLGMFGWVTLAADTVPVLSWD